MTDSKKKMARGETWGGGPFVGGGGNLWGSGYNNYLGGIVGGGIFSTI